MTIRHVGGRASLVAIALVLGIAASACGSSDTTTDSTSTTTTTVAPITTSDVATTTTTEATTTTTPAAPLPATTSASTQPAIMPNVVCMNLQEAQDAIQDAGVFFSRSRDASGQGRSQLVDRNWIVVSQTPAAGSPVTEGQAVLSAVKIGEPNSC